MNDKRATRARTPDSGLFELLEVSEEVLVRGRGRAPERATQTLVMPEEALLDLHGLSDKELTNVRFHAFFKWDNTIRHLSERGKDRSSYLTTGGV
jgi:hypothetical protein